MKFSLYKTLVQTGLEKSIKSKYTDIVKVVLNCLCSIYILADNVFVLKNDLHSQELNC